MHTMSAIDARHAAADRRLADLERDLQAAHDYQTHATTSEQHHDAYLWEMDTLHQIYEATRAINTDATRHRN